MTLRVVWEKCSVDRPVETRDGQVTKVDNVVLVRGDALPDYVTDFVRSTLVMIGAVKDFDLPVQQLQAAIEQELAPAPEPVTPPQVVTLTTGAGADAALTPGPAPARPKVIDNKEAWENYAVAMGYMSRSEAESMTKAKLMDAVDKRESA